MVRLMNIIGARPQIIKAAAISRAIKNTFSGQVEEVIVHTGQHYDENMSAVFFEELGIPTPNFNLHVGSGTHAWQTAQILEKIEKILLSSEVPFDGIIVYGDTNSTIAGALAGAKLHIPIFHIEAGLRSYNMSMPEEINRIVCDQVSSILFAPTQTAVDNLRQEGFAITPAMFANHKGRQIVLSGDVMYDNSMYFSKLSADKCVIIQRLRLQEKAFALATIHRPVNTDNAENLSQIFESLLFISDIYRLPIVVPLHPRAHKLLPKQLSVVLLERIKQSKYIQLIPPASFYEMIELEKHASIVFTDSGGVQKEAFFFQTPCVILREETEWAEIIEAGAGILSGASFSKIVSAYEQLKDKVVVFPPLFGNAHSAEVIVQHILTYLLE